MFEKDSLPFGLLLALIVPVLVFGLLLGIGANAILLNSFQKRRLYNTVRGIVLSTAVLVGLWLLLFAKYVF